MVGDGVCPADASESVLVDDSISSAMLLVMEELSPPERVALVLHDVFELEFSRIADVLGVTVPTARQYASRARRRVAHTRESARRSDPAERARLLTAFKAAYRAGDLAGLVTLLDPNVAVQDRTAGLSGMSLSEVPYPHAAENDVIVEVRAGGFTPGELDWPATWTDRSGRDRTPSVPGHELSGVVTELGFGTTGLSVGQRVVGMADWSLDGSLAEYVAVETRNLTPLPADVDDTTAAALPISGLTAWQGLFDHGQLAAGQTVLVHGAVGAVGSLAVQLARAAGAYVFGTGRAVHRDAATALGVGTFVDLDNDNLEKAGPVDLVFDVIGGEILQRSAPLVRAGGTIVTIGLPTDVRPADGRTVFFVVEPDRHRLADLVARVRSGRLKPSIGSVYSLTEAASALQGDRRASGKTIIRPGGH